MKRFLLADDHSIIRVAVKIILQEAFPFAQIAEVSDGTGLLEQLKSQPWDLLVADISMPGHNGLELLTTVRQQYPAVPVLILTMHPEDMYAVRTLKAGAAGFVSKDAATTELATAVQTILNGKKYIRASVAEKLAASVSHDTGGELHHNLASRELEIMKLLASGHSLTQIAGRLSLGLTTVSTYRSRILAKMNLLTNADLTFYCREFKLL